MKLKNMLQTPANNFDSRESSPQYVSVLPPGVVCSSPKEEKSSACRAFPPGAVALISLGVSMIAMGISVSLVPGSTSQVATGQSHPARKQPTPVERVCESSLQSVYQIYVREQMALRPPPHELVYLRGNSKTHYHWHQQCVLLNQPLPHSRPAPQVSLTQLQAERRQIDACYICSQIEKRRRETSGKLQPTS